MSMGIEVEKARLASHHLIESVEVSGSPGNPKLVAIPTDAHARWQLADESWDDYEAYVEIKA